jgi:hypothetical protein
MADELELLKDLGRETAEPDEESVRRARGLLHRRIERARGGRRRLWRPLHLRWAIVVAVALLVGSGFGFGLGSRGTESGRAGTSFVGLGFLPAKGWTVVQSEAAGTTAARAIAANVPLHPDDEPNGLPYATLEALPPHGVVVYATLTIRGDLVTDVDFPPHRLPLRFADAKRISAFQDPAVSPRGLSRYRLQAGVGAYNVDAWIYFGAAPSAGTVAGVQQQLNRLVVASQQVTLAARPSVVRWGTPITLFGSIASGRADEVVAIEMKECGVPGTAFREAVAAHTHGGGAWSTQWGLRTTTTFRAKWGGDTSAEITVRQRPYVQLSHRFGRRFDVFVRALSSFWRRQVLIQRYDRRLGTWVKVKSVVLTESTGTGVTVASGGTFRASIPRRTLVRAVLPRAQARPCYLAGYSNLLRT